MSEEFENKSLSIENEENELLKTLLKKQKKQLFYSRITGVAMAVLVAVVIMTLVVIVPKTITTLEHVNTVISQVEGMLGDVQVSIDNIDNMTAEIAKAAEGINVLVDDNAEVLNEAMTKINDIDFDSLNDAIRDLSSVVQPLARLTKMF